MKRKCIYTNEDSDCLDRIIPSDEVHNWTLKTPCNSQYRESKGTEPPTDLEMEIHETFYLLELSKIKVKYLEVKLLRLQEENKGNRKPIKKTGAAKKNKEKIKDKQIQASMAIKDILEDNEPKIQELLENRKRSIF
jgi:hypothetical protein